MDDAEIKPDLKDIESYINHLNGLIANDADETRKRRWRISADVKDWELARMMIEYEEALHICRTYDMRRKRHEIERALNPFAPLTHASAEAL